jgi:hypothetical protein
MSTYMELLASDEAYQQMARWAAWLCQANYPTEIHATGEGDFPYEWRVSGPGWDGPQVATISSDGCGASWHGPDDLWLKVIGPHEGVTA